MLIQQPPKRTAMTIREQMRIRDFFLVFFLVFSMIVLLSGAHPIVKKEVASSLYGNVTLPCTFSFVKGLTGLTMIWVKNKNHREVIIYKLLDGEQNLDEQDPRYEGRVELSTDIPQGELHLKMRNITYEDEGMYYCRAANYMGHGDKEVILSIDGLNAVETTVTLVTIAEKRYMKCRGEGVYYGPEVQWITAQGEDLSRYGNHSITEQSDGWMVVESVLHYEVDKNVQVLCHIKEGRLTRSARAVISDGKHAVILDNS